LSIKNFDIDKELLHALLNSTIIISQIEGLGFGRGETVLDLNPTNLKNGLYVPKIENINASYQEKIKKYFLDIMKEPIMSIDEIIRSNFRKDFDKLIFESININKDYINTLYENLETLYKIRKSSKD
jgi:ethanolamine ammonia-lyase large subunit